MENSALIMDRRRSLIHDCLGPTDELLQKLLLQDGSLNSFCRNDECIGLAYGTLVRSIERENLMDTIIGRETWTRSAEELKNKLAKVFFKTLADVRGHGHNNTVHVCRLSNLRLSYMTQHN